MCGKVLDRAEIGGDTIESFLALGGLATVSSPIFEPAALCSGEKFHWNGSELVICSLGPARWSGLNDVTLDVTLVSEDLQLQFQGGGKTDRVVGVAPEYREQLVRYLGPSEGHAEADSVPRNADTHRLFVTPFW